MECIHGYILTNPEICVSLGSFNLSYASEHWRGSDRIGGCIYM